MDNIDSYFEADLTKEVEDALIKDVENLHKSAKNKSVMRKNAIKTKNLSAGLNDVVNENITMLDAFSEPISDVTYDNVEDYDFENELSNTNICENVDNIEKTAKKSKIDDNISNLEKILNDYNQKFQEDVKLTPFNLKDKSLMEASIKAKWASTLQAERTRGKLLAKSRDALIETLKEELSGSVVNGAYMHARQQIDAAINSNQTVKKLRQDIADNKQIVELLEMFWVVIQGFGFTIKNSIETMKLDMGI